MTTLSTPRLIAALTLAVLGLSVAAGITTAAPTVAPEAAPAVAPQAPAQGGACDNAEWVKLASNTSQPHFFPASAYAPHNNGWYFYGGADRNLDADNLVALIDMSADDINSATGPTRLTAGSAQRRYGHSLHYVPGESEAEHSLVSVAGSDDTEATPDVWVYNISSNAFTSAGASGSFQDRLHHAAAYSPKHDTIVINNGTNSCLADADPTERDTCDAMNVGTTYLERDDEGNWTFRAGPTGGPSNVYGHSMVWDSTNEQMIVYGGTSDGSRTSSDLWTLDMSEDDAAAATWQRHTGVAGAGSRAFHSAAFDASRSWMIVFGGVAQNFQQTGERTVNSTYALDVSDMSNISWMNLSATAPGNNLDVGSTMGYSGKHETVMIHGGRNEFRSGTTANVSNESYYLSCMADDMPTPTTEPPPATNTPAGPTATPGGQDTPVPPTPTVDTSGQICEFIQGRVPPAVINAASANPQSVQGFNQLHDPGKPESPANPRRTWLSIQTISQPYHPLYNPLSYKVGCP